MILPFVLELVRNSGLSVSEPESYAKILRAPFENLQGDNAEGAVVSGTEFWAAAPKGAAGSYSSSAGRRVLAAKMRQLLPEVTID